MSVFKAAESVIKNDTSRLCEQSSQWKDLAYFFFSARHNSKKLDSTLETLPNNELTVNNYRR